MTETLVAEQKTEDQADEKTTFAALVREYDGLDSPQKIAEAIWHGHGVGVFELMPESWVIALLADRVRRYGHTQKAHHFHVEVDVPDMNGRPRTGVCRMAVDGDYWSSPWLIRGVWKETRELTRADIALLLADARDDEAQIRGKILFLRAVDDLASKHGAKTLEDLRKKGIELPSVEFRAEAE